MADSPTRGELDAVVAFIAAQQEHSDRQITYVGTEAGGIAAELDGLAPPWASTVRVLRDGPDGTGLSGVVVTEWDEELGRAWIVGPWVAGDGEGWMAGAAELLDAALAQTPAAVTRYELAGDIANQRLAALAATRAWAPTEASHILVADAGVVAAWPDPAAELRAAGADDVVAIAPLHDAEFPGTYASAAQLVDGQRDGSRVVLVAEEVEGGLAGYAAGMIHEDGEGFIDFVVVDPTARRSGLGRRLVVAITRELLERSPLDRVALTVQDHRDPARALYERLGFRPEGTLVAYRSWSPE